jgi:hypothetical protein
MPEDALLPVVALPAVAPLPLPLPLPEAAVPAVDPLLPDVALPAGDPAPLPLQPLTERRNTPRVEIAYRNLMAVILPCRILGVSGSLQCGSGNRTLLETARQLAPALGADVVLFEGTSPVSPPREQLMRRLGARVRSSFDDDLR